MKELEAVLSHPSNGTMNTKPYASDNARSTPSNAHLPIPSQTPGYSHPGSKPVTPVFSSPQKLYLPNPVMQIPPPAYPSCPVQMRPQNPKPYLSNPPVQTQPFYNPSPSSTTTPTGQLPSPSPNKPAYQLPLPPPPRHSAAQTIKEPRPVSTQAQQAGKQQPTNPRESYIDRKLTAAELEILWRTSTINGTEFLPWNASDSVITDTMPFTDSYDYNLIDQQKQKGGHFIQPMEKYQSCSVVNYPIDPNCVRQNAVADCTIISSMISCANYEVRFKKPLISGIIFPHQGGRPVYSSSGKYRVKLYFNGIPRRVEIDHRILVDKNNNELCTFSKHTGELWPMLIEKANLKVHGGYGYDGGNGSQDTYALTGWIPEYFAFNSTNSEGLWKRICSAFK